MGRDSPRPSSSKRASQNLETPPRTSSALKHRASGVKSNTRGGPLESNGEGSDSVDGSRRGGSLGRGDTTGEPKKLASSVDGDGDAVSPTDNPAEPKKRVVRLTLTEAAEEIKRLRHFERRMNVEIKQYEEDAKNYKEQISRLKQQVVDNERAHQEEMAARTSAYESEIKRLKTQLQNTSDELHLLQETSLPLAEARKLTFKALPLYKLLENAVGTDHAVFRATHGFACGVQSYTDSHLRLLRQEQLILLAENERLQAQIQEMQHETENKRRDRLLQQEAIVAGKLDGNLPSQESYERPIESGASRSMSKGFHKEATESHGLMKAQSLHSTSNKQAEMELAKTNLRSVCSTLKIGETRLLSYAFSRLYSHCVAESVVRTMEKAINKTNVEFRKETIVTGCALVTSFVRTSEKAKVLRAFWILILSARMQNHAKEIQALKEQLKRAQEQEAASAGRKYSAAPCHSSAIRPSAGPERGDPTAAIGLPPSQGGGIPLPVAYAPHYFRNLPSAQRRRNVYFTATPPRVQEQFIPSTIQRARDMALSEETLYRPISLAEGWKGTGTNGLGIGMEPVGTVIGSHATSQGSKLEAAKGSLKGALGLPQTTPSSQPLTAAERNNAYMEQLLRSSEERTKLQ
ncbi:hypothetical protein, conserved [Eimeria maxima]|uniref:Uncharacterized protein n=1 Tax=Eimeria maxima TaxID=5804 RepID=U6MG22_EIMMA|nr:hypothetical protein, conserved [Eimeria maxima]CDJ60580.1 hypothetical protein, conserved [Eimeria maxima]